MTHADDIWETLDLPCTVTRWDNSAEPGGHYHCAVENEFDVVIEYFDDQFWIGDIPLTARSVIVKSPLNDAPIVMTEDMADVLFHPAMTS